MCFVRNAETELYVPSVANSSWWFGHEPDEASSSLGGGSDFSSWDVESKDPGELGQDFKDTERRPVPHDIVLRWPFYALLPLLLHTRHEIWHNDTEDGSLLPSVLFSGFAFYDEEGT